MIDPALPQKLDDLARDLDLVVFRLERDASDDVEALKAERQRIRRELERLHRQLEELLRSVG